MSHKRLAQTCLTLCLLFGASIQAADEYRVTITASEKIQNSLVEFALPLGVGDHPQWELVDDAGGSLLTQAALGEPRRLWTMPGHAGAKTFTLRPAPHRDEEVRAIEHGPQLSQHDGQLQLLDSPRQILSYHIQTSHPPDGIAPYYARSGHIHPLMVPFNQPITAEFPADHPHQNGLFFAWVHTEFDGHEVDFWNLGKQLGKVRHKHLVESQTGKIYAGFIADLEHVDLTNGETVVLNESWRVMALPIRDPRHDYYLVDLESKQIAASDKPLKVQTYHYGGFGWRGLTEWLLPAGEKAATGCEFLTSEGLDRLKGNHTRPAWVAVTGLISGQACTIAIFGHPSNFRHPQPVRLHPSKPYFCFSPCVLGDFEIANDQPLVSKYRIVTHQGPADPEFYTQLVHDWAEPSKVTFEP